MNLQKFFRRALYSVLPFTVAKESLNDIIFAINFINGELLNGSFYFDIQNKTICYRLTTSYTDSILGTGLFHYMIMISLNTIEEYNDKLFMINKGMLTMEQFIDNEVNGQK